MLLICFWTHEYVRSDKIAIQYDAHIHVMDISLPETRFLNEFASPNSRILNENLLHDDGDASFIGSAGNVQFAL